jgi:hypothetical protein
LTHPQIGRDLLDRFAEQIKEHGVVERPPLLEGKSMHISVASTHKPKVHEPTPSATAKAHARPSDEGGDEIATAQDIVNVAPPAPPAPPRPEPENGSASTGV